MTKNTINDNSRQHSVNYKYSKGSNEKSVSNDLKSEKPLLIHNTENQVEIPEEIFDLRQENNDLTTLSEIRKNGESFFGSEFSIFRKNDSKMEPPKFITGIEDFNEHSKLFPMKTQTAHFKVHSQNNMDKKGSEDFWNTTIPKSSMNKRNSQNGYRHKFHEKILESKKYEEEDSSDRQDGDEKIKVFQSDKINELFS